jgi:hypothetical protein
MKFLVDRTRPRLRPDTNNDLRFWRNSALPLLDNQLGF